MNKFMPRGSMGEHFSRVWLAIVLLFLISLFGVVEYNRAVVVHTEVMRGQDRLEFMVDALRKRIEAIVVTMP